MGNRIWNQEVGKHPNTKQNNETYNRRKIGTRSDNLVKLIGANKVQKREFNYEGTYYVTEDGEVYDKEQVISQKAQKTGISFYEITNWKYKYERTKKLYYPSIRRIVIIKNTNNQLSLNL